ncbi:helix-turn-helix domain-containing protein [Streptomyces sp. HMX87]|uniref:helix-turn-helix domain-containing protein n=1 Tax=Streptomyces sp. HMX87 TaxID=3390849 RepID=UPI003A8605E0
MAAQHMWNRFFAPEARYRELGLVCLGVGVQRGPLPVVGPRTLDRHVAVVITAGAGWFRHGNRAPRPVRAPVLLWLTPGVPHHYGPAPGTGWDETFVAFTGPATSTYTRLGYISPDRPVVPLARTDEVSAIAQRIIAAARPGNPLADVEAAVAVHQLLPALREARADGAPGASGGVDDPLLEALARDAFLPLSVDGHAARLGMSSTGLRQAVRRASGRGPKDFLLSVRLGRAQELLAGTDLPTATVARMVGYADPAYFSRVFHRRVGVPPSVFRARESRGGTVARPTDG